MNAYTYKISFKITHSSKNLNDIFLNLKEIQGVIPGMLNNVGDERKTPLNTELEGKNVESWFYLDFSKEKQSSHVQDLSDSLLKILEKISIYKDTFIELTLTGGRIVFFVGLFIDANSGLVFEPKLFQKFAEMGISLEFDIYPSDAKSGMKKVSGTISDIKK